MTKVYRATITLVHEDGRKEVLSIVERLHPFAVKVDAAGRGAGSTSLEVENEVESSLGGPRGPVVHYIRRWSGVKADETPLCGADAWSRTLAGETHDTAGQPMNICPECAQRHTEATE